MTLPVHTTVWGASWERVPKPLTTGEVAELLGVSKPTVVRACRHGVVNPGRTLGGHRRFSQEMVQILQDRTHPWETPLGRRRKDVLDQRDRVVAAISR